MKKILIGLLSVASIILFASCSKNISVKDLKANDWQMTVKEDKDEMKVIISFSDHVMSLKIDTSEMTSDAENEWEKMGEDLGKQFIEKMNFQVEYELKGKNLYFLSKQENLDSDYEISKDGKNIVLTPQKDKKLEKLILKPYKKTKTTKISSAKKTKSSTQESSISESSSEESELSASSITKESSSLSNQASQSATAQSSQSQGQAQNQNQNLQGSGETTTVQPREGLAQIAARTGVSIEKLAELNGLTLQGNTFSPAINPGDSIRIN